MAIDRAKVLGKLLVKYKGKSLTKNFLEKTADKYAAKIAEDADDAAIDEFINDRDDIIQEAISETDRRVTEAVKKATTKTTETTTPEDKTDELPSDTPEWAKGLLKNVTALQGEITSMKAEKTQQTLTQRFQSDERLKGIDPKLLKGRIPTTEDGLEAAILEAAEDLKEFVKVEGGTPPVRVGNFGNDKPNFGGKQANNNTNVQQKAVLDQVKKFTDTLPKPKATEISQPQTQN